MWLAAVGGAALVAAAAAGIAFTFARGGGAEAGTCVRQEFPAQGQNHVPPAKIPKGFEYNSFPPTSGYHAPQPVILDAYTDVVPQRQLTHNLEHGAIVVQYGERVSQETMNRIIEWYRQDPAGIVVAPLPDVPKAQKLGDKITLAAWTGRTTPVTDETTEIDPADEEPQKGHLATCSGFDEGEFSDFRDDYRFRGPEPFQPNQLQPGMGM
jgi:hypothetical protein